jgi:hypothetical protein
MNRTEYLLTCLSEECAEVQKNVGKALRFGLNTRYKGSGSGINAQKITRELIDIDAIVSMLIGDKVLKPIDYNNFGKFQIAKIKKVERLMSCSRQTGNLR